MFISFLVFLFIWYSVSVVSVYLYAVIKNYEITKIWTFKIKDGYIGVCKCPKWCFWWFELLMLLP